MLIGNYAGQIAIMEPHFFSARIPLVYLENTSNLRNRYTEHYYYKLTRLRYRMPFTRLLPEKRPSLRLKLRLSI